MNIISHTYNRFFVFCQPLLIGFLNTMCCTFKPLTTCWAIFMNIGQCWDRFKITTPRSRLKGGEKSSPTDNPCWISMQIWFSLTSKNLNKKTRISHFGPLSQYAQMQLGGYSQYAQAILPQNHDFGPKINSWLTTLRWVVICFFHRFWSRSWRRVTLWLMVSVSALAANASFWATTNKVFGLWCKPYKGTAASKVWRQNRLSGIRLWATGNQWPVNGNCIDMHQALRIC